MENPSWPNPANIFIVPDNEGFSLIDVGCGSDSSINLLLEGLSYWGLNIKKLHTIILSHAHPDHISLFERQSSILLAGDLVGPSPAWYTPTSGGVIGYLESLAKLERLEADIILPAQGRLLKTQLEPSKRLGTGF